MCKNVESCARDVRIPRFDVAVSARGDAMAVAVRSSDFAKALANEN
jgi:hypothetical protein